MELAKLNRVEGCTEPACTFMAAYQRSVFLELYRQKLLTDDELDACLTQLRGAES